VKARQKRGTRSKRQYKTSTRARRAVRTEMKSMRAGKSRAKSRKQAVAIGLRKARKKGAKVRGKGKSRKRV
jgi:hypothetical protein